MEGSTYCVRSLETFRFEIRKCPVLLSIKFRYLIISSVHCVFIEGFKKLATDGSAVLIWALLQHSTFGEEKDSCFSTTQCIIFLLLRLNI